MTDIILKQGTGVPSDTDLEVAEVAIDSSSGAMYTKLADGSVKHLNPEGGSAAGGLSGQWEYAGSASAGKFSSRNQDWYTATTFSFHNTDAGGGKHTLALVSEGDIIVLGSEDGLRGAEYRVLSVAPNLDVYTFTVDPISFFGQFFSDGEMVNADFVPQLEEESLWEQNGDDIYYDAGNVGIGTDDPQHPLTTTVGNRRISFKAGDVINVAEMRAHNEDDTGLAYMQYSAYDHEFHTDAGEVLRIRRDGKVGIGTNDPAETLTVAGPILSNKANYASNQDQAYMIAAAKGYDGSTEHWGKHGYQHRLKSNSTGGSRITIDTHLGEMWSMGSEGRTTFAGNVGIGMTPLTRDAKEQLAEWSGWIEAKLELEPSLDRKAATLDVTDGAFEVLPTEDKLAEWMETRAAGDQLQVGGQGDISASGMIKALKPSEFGKPSDLWNISGWYGISNYGGLCTGGGYGVTLTSNGYRNSSDTWTSLNAAGKTGAAVIQLLPDGKIEFRQDADKADGSANTPNLRATFHADGSVTHTGKVSISIDENGGQTLTVRNSNATASHGVKVIHGGGGTGTYPFFSETTGGVETFRVDGAGNVIAKGTVTATETKAIPDTIYWKNSAESVGLRLSATEMYPVNAANSGLKSNTISVGAEASKFKNGYFAGVVDAGYFTTTADNYFISRGSGGWMNATHGGGWYQSDATWVRTYGNKAVYVGNTGANAIAASGDIVAYYSDERLKDVQGPIENPLDKVDAIETFYYTHNDIAKSLGYEGDEVQVGVSAQSVKAVMPEVVCRAPVDMDADGGSLTGEDYMTVKYERLVPLLLESIKELRKEIEELKRG